MSTFLLKTLQTVAAEVSEVLISWCLSADNRGFVSLQLMLLVIETDKKICLNQPHLCQRQVMWYCTELYVELTINGGSRSRVTFSALHNRCVYD